MKRSRPEGLLARRDLLVNLTLRELRGKYKRSALGWAWSMINPIATMLIFTLVFKVLLKLPNPIGNPSGLQVFALFLLCGLLPWNFLANSLSGSVTSLVGNAGLIKKVYFPRSVLPAASVLSWVVHLLIELGILSIAMMLFGNFVLPWLPVAILIVVLQTIFVMGVGLGLSAINVYFRDVEHFLGIFILLWFYSSPIIYPASLIPDSRVILGMKVPIKAILDLNPMVHFIGAYRAVFYDLRMPDARSIAFMVGYAALSFTLGWTLFNRLQKRFAEEL
ncbi:MAG: ABC transporter permease [Actinomycetota bacterium]